MKKSIVAATALAGIGLSGVGFSNSVYAATSPIISGDGTETCIEGPALHEGAACSLHIISDLDTTWQTANPLGQGAKWISYADTGPLGTTLAPPRGSSANPGGTTVVAIFTEAFQARVGDAINLFVWADDTVRIRIDGLVVLDTCFNVSGDFLCPDTPVAFDPPRGGYVQHSFGAPGLHTVAFEVYQTGILGSPNNNPFGLLYSGELQTAVPLPAALPLFLSGLAAVGVVARKRRKLLH